MHRKQTSRLLHSLILQVRLCFTDYVSFLIAKTRCTTSGHSDRVSVLAAGWYLVFSDYLLAKRGQTIGETVAGTKVVGTETNELATLILQRQVFVQIVSIIQICGSLFDLR